MNDYARQSEQIRQETKQIHEAMLEMLAAFAEMDKREEEENL
jgi:hypothetical protein